MASISYLQSSSNATGATSYTFTNRNVGPEDVGRYIIIAVSARGIATGNAVTSATIGDVTATIIGESINSAGSTSSTTTILLALLPTGTTATVVVNFTVGTARCNISMYTATGIDPSPLSVQQSIDAAPTASIATAINGIALGSAMSNGDTTTTWSGLTESFDGSYGPSNATHSVATASNTSAGTLVATATFASSQLASGIFVSWASNASSGTGGSGTIKTWNGSAWVEKPIKVWNGSAWVTKSIKVWDGSNYVTKS